MAIVNMKRVVLVTTLSAVLVLVAVFAFTWGSLADRIATLVSSLAAIGSIGATIWVATSTRSQSGAAEYDRAAGRANPWSSEQDVVSWYPAPVRRERLKVRPRFVFVVFPAALIAGAALGAADLSWGPLADFRKYQIAWHNVGALAFAAVVVAGFTRPSTQRLGLAASLVMVACWLILENDRLLSGEDDDAVAWALARTEAVGWLPYALILLLALAWLVLREAPPVSLWVAVLAPGALFLTSNFARSIIIAVDAIASTRHGYGMTFVDILVNSAGLAVAVAVASWVFVRLYGADD